MIFIVAACDSERSRGIPFLASAMIFAGDNCPIARTDLGNEMAAIRGTQDDRSKRHDSIDSLPVENGVMARRKQAFESVAKTNHFPPDLVCSECYNAQNALSPGQSLPLVSTPMRGFIRKSEVRGVFLDRQGDRQLPIDRKAASRVAAGQRLR
jgi:hypothetical protein